MKTLPVMPRCRMIVSPLVRISRYLARRSTASMTRPFSLRSTPFATGQRKRRSRTMTLLIVVSRIHGSIPRRLVSTSGNSGMAYCDAQRRSRTSMYKKARTRRALLEQRRALLLDLGFFINHMLANRRIVFLRFQLFRVQAFVFRSRVEVAGSGTRYEFDFVAHLYSSA